MKIQCACGAKFAFEVTPEQAQQPVKFVCPSCGRDSSDYVTALVRQQFGLTAPAAPAIDVAPPPQIAPPPNRPTTDVSPAASAPALRIPSAPVKISVAPPAPAPVAPQPVVAPPAPVPAAAPHVPPPPVTRPTPPVAPPVSVQTRLRRDEPKPQDTGEPVKDARFCLKHPGMRTTENCVVCQKPICPRCMELFGYVCSPHCKEKADLQGIDVPVFEGQSSLVERRKWRKVGLIAGSITAAILGFVAVWCWYSWYGSRPHVAFAVRFEKQAYSGESVLAADNQIVFLHGGKLARYDLKQQKEIWSLGLIDDKAIEIGVDKTIKALQEAQRKRDQERPDADPIPIPSREEMVKMAERYEAAALQLRVVGKNIWVTSDGKLVQHDWDTGKAGKELPMRDSFRGMIARGDELLMLDQESGKEIVTHINLATGTTETEKVAVPEDSTTNVAAKTAPPAKSGIAKTGGRTAKKETGGGLPVTGADPDGAKPLDPQKVGDQVSRMSLPGQIALPALLSLNRGQQRALDEMNDNGRPRSSSASAEDFDAPSGFVLIPARDGYVQFSTRLIEHRLVTREAMKAKPKKSALDGAVNVTQSMEVANEIFNDMQRDAGGGSVTEDESRYQVTVRRADGKGNAEWTAEVVGSPSLYPLKSVNVVAVNKKIIVLDKDNKKLWESALTYNVVGRDLDGDSDTTGQGPCVERENVLYVFDQGVLSAFNLKTGDALWRLPSVGISGLFFDDHGMMYVNSTTAGPDSIKYSRQIDLSTKTSGLILKVDPHTGKQLWARETRGGLHYISGKYLYTFESHQAPTEEDGGRRMQVGLETESFFRVRRINPSNGKDMWAHYQPRCPLDAKFDKNTIHLVFKKEVQVLKFISF